MSVAPKSVEEHPLTPLLCPQSRRSPSEWVRGLHRFFRLCMTTVPLVAATATGAQVLTEVPPTSNASVSSNASLIDPGYTGTPVAPVPLKPVTAFVLGSRVNLRDRPGNDGKIFATLRIGTQVEVLSVYQQQVRVRASSGDEGWISTDLLTPELPTVALCLERASTTPGTEQRVWLERAQELAPWNLQVLTQLRDAYRKQGDPRAEILARRIDPTSPLMLGTCLQGQCRIWLELDQGRFFIPSPPGLDAAQRKRRIERVRAVEGWFPLENQRLAGWYTPTRLENKREKPGNGKAREETKKDELKQKEEGKRGVGIGFEDPLIADGELVSRVLQLLPPPTELPDKQFLQDQVVEWMGTEAAGWEKASRTGKTPQSLRLFHLWSSSRGTALALEPAYELRAGHEALGQRVYGVVFAWMDTDGKLTFTPATDWFRATGGETPPIRSTRVHSVLDLEGDGKPEVMLRRGEAGSREVERLPAQLELWRGQERDQRGQFQLEVRAEWGE